MDKQEKIYSAAVRFAIPKDDYKGVKIVTGIDYESIYNDGILSYLAHDQHQNIWQNGFMTTSGRFVDPIEAQKVAIESGQYVCPNAEISKLEKAIDGHWFNIQHAKSHHAIAIYKRYIAEDKAKIEELKAGYLGAEFRVEDLHYGKP